MNTSRRVRFLWPLLLVPALAWRVSSDEPGRNPPKGHASSAEVQPAGPASPVADNRRCFVCHANYEDEQLSVVHAKANVSCIRCHGVCSPHSTDEDGLTAPDRMYPKSQIRLNCLICHDWMKLIESDKTKINREDLKEKPNHQAVLDGTNREKRFCTDCHGEHRMYFRTKIWNKRTGVLISKDAIPRMVPTLEK